MYWFDVDVGCALEEVFVEVLVVVLPPDDAPDVVVLVSEVCVSSCDSGSSSASPNASSDARLITALRIGLNAFSCDSGSRLGGTSV